MLFTLQMLVKQRLQEKVVFMVCVRVAIQNQIQVMCIVKFYR